MYNHYDPQGWDSHPENKSEPVNITPFVYPNDEDTSPVRDENILRLLDFISYYVLADRNPTLCLMALAYMNGYDLGQLYNCENTIKDICLNRGISYKQFERKMQSIKIELNNKT